MQPLDIIEFKLTQFTFGPDREPSNVAAIYVNGKSFIDIAEEGELPSATKNGEAGRAGNYVWTRVWELFDELTEVQDIDSDDYCEPRILDCGCGCFGCWPLHVKITETEDIVTWSGFYNPFKTDPCYSDLWDYSGMRAYHFDKKQYRKELLKLYNWLDMETDKETDAQQTTLVAPSKTEMYSKEAWDEYHKDKTCGFVSQCPCFFFKRKYEEEDGGLIAVSPGNGSTCLYIADTDFYFFREAITFSTGKVFDDHAHYEFTCKQWYQIIETAEKILCLKSLEEVLDFTVQRKITGLKDRFNREQYIYVADLMRECIEIANGSEREKYQRQIKDMKDWTLLVLKEDELMRVSGL